jgi:hypothetical protein
MALDPTKRAGKPWDATWGLRIGVVLAAAALIAAVFALRGDDAARPSEHRDEAVLTPALLETYLDTALEVRLGRRDARAAGIKPAAWAEHPRVAGALERAGWSMADYMRVEGQVNAARLEIQAPGSVHDLDDPNSRPVPPEHLALVRERLTEVQRVQGPLGA